MAPPYGLILFGVLFFGFMTVLGVVQARRKKENVYYTSSVGSFLILLGFVFIFLNQFVLVVALVGVAFILSIIGLPKVLKIQEQQLQEVDLSAPLRRRDLLSNRMWLKLAYKWGLWKSVSIFALFTMTVTAGMSYIILNAYSSADTLFILGYTISFTIGSTTLLHHQISKVLKEAKSMLNRSVDRQA